LLDAALASQADFEKNDEQATQVADEAADFADNSPFPGPEELHSDIMVDGSTALSYRYEREER